MGNAVAVPVVAWIAHRIVAAEAGRVETLVAELFLEDGAA